MFIPHRKHITFPLRVQQVNAICRFVTGYINVILLILDFIHRPVFYLNLFDDVRTSQEAHYVSTTIPAG
jgi:hypothetical protein